MITFFSVILAYLLGSLSFAVITSKLMGLTDPRHYGSGNPGATNVLRTGNKKAAALTLIGDALKGWVAVILCQTFGSSFGLGEQSVALVGLFVLIGHIWPLYFKFKGGKGVATALGVLIGFNVWLGLAALLTWLILACLVRISSLSAIIACIAVPFYAYFIVGFHSVYFGASLIIALIVFQRHKSNLVKLIMGKEGRIGDKIKTGQTPPPDSKEP